MSRFSLIAVLVLSATACSKSEERAAPTPTSTTAKPAKDPAAAKKLIAEGAVVVDVRTPDEFGAGRLPQATNIPLQDFAQRIAEIDKLAGGDKTRPIVVYCASGARSAKAKQQLEAAGYTHVVNGGGFDDLE